MISAAFHSNPPLMLAGLAAVVVLAAWLEFEFMSSRR